MCVLVSQLRGSLVVPTIHTHTIQVQGKHESMEKNFKKIAIVRQKMMLLFSKRNYFIKISVLWGQNDGFFLNVN